MLVDMVVVAALVEAEMKDVEEEELAVERTSDPVDSDLVEDGENEEEEEEEEGG